MTVIHCDYIRFTIHRELSDAALTDTCIKLFNVPFEYFTKRNSGEAAAFRCAEGYTLKNYVNIYRGGFAKNRGTVCFDIPGSGIRDALILDIPQLCQYVRENSGTFTRFDIAADDTGHLLPFDEIVELCTGANFKQRVKTKLCRNSRDSVTGEPLERLPTISTQPRRIQFGSEKSANYAVLYDREYVAGCSYPYLRFELRISNRQDLDDLSRQIAYNQNDPGQYMAGILKSKLDFKSDDNAQKVRCSSLPWWDQFLLNAQATRLKRAPSPTKPVFGNSVVRAVYNQIDKLISLGHFSDIQEVIAYSSKKLESLGIPSSYAIEF